MQKNQGQRSVRSKHGGKPTNGQTDTTDRITFPANTIGKHVSTLNGFGNFYSKKNKVKIKRHAL